MTFGLEYHKAVQRSIPATLALFGLFLFTPLLAFSNPGQVSGSATSTSSGGHGFSGGGPGAMSPGHSFAPPTGPVAPPTGAVAPPTGAIAPPTAGANSHNQGFSHQGPHGMEHHHRHHAAFSDFYYPYGYAVPVPYAVDDNTDDTNADDDPEYQGGPTVFDRRGAGRDSYVPPSYPGPAHARQTVQAGSTPTDDPPISESSSAPVPETPQPTTTLVFKDGHQVEVENYAIVNQTLYDLTSGHPRKIALADLDLAATEKQNDDRGITFQLPPSAQAN